ncbi:MAG: hypothetical protein ACTSRZ_10535 [Promethearchaeota archaeon]
MIQVHEKKLHSTHQINNDSDINTSRKDSNLISCLIVDILRNLYYSIFGTFSLLFADIGFYWFIGVWNYADWKYQLPNALLCLLIGVEGIAYAYFYHFDGIKFINFIISLILLEIFLHLLVSREIIMSNYLEEKIPFVLGILILIYFLSTTIVAILSYINRKKRNFSFKNSTRSNNKEININNNKKLFLNNLISKIFNLKTSLIIWLFTVPQAILSYFGYSLFNFFLI